MNWPKTPRIYFRHCGSALYIACWHIEKNQYQINRKSWSSRWSAVTNFPAKPSFPCILMLIVNWMPIVFCHFQILAVTIGSTWLAFIKPSINAFFLMTLGIPSIVVLGYNLKREDDRRVINLGWRSILFWVASVTCWINDRIYCNFWSRYYICSPLF